VTVQVADNDAIVPQNCFESSLRHGCVVVGYRSSAYFPFRIISAATLSMIDHGSARNARSCPRRAE
jgi:hypothetical protein